MSLPPYIVAQKEVGETPLSVLSRVREAYNIPIDVPLSYAGRLDPMASGSLLVLVGDTCKRQHLFTKLDKEYIVEVLLGVGSDTGDVLGLPIEGASVTPSLKEVCRVLKQEAGVHTVAYPAFSSKTVHGKPLFLHTLEGTLTDIEIPVHKEAFYQIKLCGMRTYSKEDLKKRISAHLAKTPRTSEPSKHLGADFRIDAVTSAWNTLLEATSQNTFTVIEIRVTSGSGSYMRTLAGRIGEGLGTCGLALSIHRTRIGAYFPLLKLWLKRFS